MEVYWKRQVPKSRVCLCFRGDLEKNLEKICDRQERSGIAVQWNGVGGGGKNIFLGPVEYHKRVRIQPPEGRTDVFGTVSVKACIVVSIILIFNISLSCLSKKSFYKWYLCHMTKSKPISTLYALRQGDTVIMQMDSFSGG